MVAGLLDAAGVLDIVIDTDRVKDVETVFVAGLLDTAGVIDLVMEVDTV